MDELDQMPRQLIERYMAAFFVLSKRLNAQINEVIQDNATLDQYQIIDYIATHDEVTSTMLAEASSVGKSSITAITTRLVDRGVLQRIGDVNDRRVIYLSLTEHGRTVYSNTQRMIMDMISTYLIHFTKEEIDGFIKPFEKLARLVEEGS
ncbi:MarR family winged helix-turn-helix transcriptional regulator [Paenibacillus sp. D2_2]|uniref:MarR family winged helix-turn-helix transcriptional regulator n=1 Tax=Paenibacillus sp. D2_2 TaxID=3073092 RepID=UPI0028157CE9|nr:MarR family winged helix-turn-helix transcriptional regulator [Paenibacillus sp. D2_2]WMT39233.1 MarR family winged helix-turn-helix transcriptional regulator [Paenibacillus sp. D2_2]